MFVWSYQHEVSLDVVFWCDWWVSMNWYHGLCNTVPSITNNLCWAMNQFIVPSIWQVVCSHVSFVWWVDVQSGTPLNILILSWEEYCRRVVWLCIISRWYRTFIRVCVWLLDKPLHNMSLWYGEIWWFCLEVWCTSTWHFLMTLQWLFQKWSLIAD